MKLLLIEDDDDMRTVLAGALEDEGYAVDRAVDGQEGLYRASEWSYDAVLLDVMLPRLDGRNVLRQLRRTKNTPVLMLTARGEVADRVGGLDDGADDYLTKPFELDELLARLRAMIRRSADAPRMAVRLGKVTVDLRERTVRREENAVELTRYEFLLLETLVLNRGRVVSRRDLEDRLYDETREAASNTLEVLVSRLRRKLGKDFIATRRGIGYGVGLDPATSGR